MGLDRARHPGQQPDSLLLLQQRVIRAGLEQGAIIIARMATAQLDILEPLPVSPGALGHRLIGFEAEYAEAALGERTRRQTGAATDLSHTRSQYPQAQSRDGSIALDIVRQHRRQSQAVGQLVVDDHDGNARVVPAQEAAGLGKLVLVGREHPALAKDVLHLERKKIGVGVATLREHRKLGKAVRRTLAFGLESDVPQDPFGFGGVHGGSSSGGWADPGTRMETLTG